MSVNNYYDFNAEPFIQSTFFVDMKAIYDRFEKYLTPGMYILDAGCGPGRDAKYFIGKGYNVLGFDSSQAMVDAANINCGYRVFKMEFSQMDYNNEFDGIWCCASLLHVPKREINSVFQKIIDALKPGGVWYLSFKYGNSEREKEGRIFNDYTFTTLLNELIQFGNIKILEMWSDGDIRPGFENIWINAIIKKAK